MAEMPKNKETPNEWENSSSGTDFEENETLLGNGGVSPIRQPHTATRIRQNWLWLFLTIINILVLGSSILILTISRRSCGNRILEGAAFQKTQSFSPVYNSFSPSLHDVTVNGTLFNYPPSVYRTDPSREVDREWDRIAPAAWLLFSRADIVQLGKDPATRAKASPELLVAMGHSADAELYLGWVDAFHQTHCLNVLRKHSYWDYYYSSIYGDWSQAQELHWTHVSHCLDIIRQNLQCNANADAITMVWREGQAGPWPDFNIQKKCGDFEGLLEWQEKEMIPSELADQYIYTPEEDKIDVLYPAQPELYAAKKVEPPKDRVFDHEVLEHKNWYSSW